jgi:hypothetical protein
MPGDVMLLDGFDDDFDNGVAVPEGWGEYGEYGDLGASQPPALLSAFVAEMAKEPNLRAWLRREGARFAKLAIDKITGTLGDDPPNPYVNALLGPFLAEFWAGAMPVIMGKIRPIAIGTALLAAGGGVVFGLLVGRRSRRSYEAGRQGLVPR